MDQEQYEAIVTRLEHTAQQDPRGYLFTVFGVALLGFGILGLAIGLSLLGVALLIGLVAVVVLSGGKALLVLVKLFKLVVLLALPAWVMVGSAMKMLFSRFTPPAGRALERHEAPALFERIDEVRARMRGPRIDSVLLVDELNAAIVQHPRFGLFGWERNVLILGLPLLQALREDEALAVVAHEYGHLSGHHSRFGGFIYRMRAAWGRLEQLSAQWNDWGSRLIARLFRWYAPRFNAYTFVLARQNEYIADQAAVELVGAQATGSALSRVNIAALYAQEEFWPAIERRMVSEPEPLADRSGAWKRAIGSGLDDATSQRLLERAALRETDHADTHPALRDRLAAMGLRAEPQVVAAAPGAGESAAERWLGRALDGLRAELDQAWRNDIADGWRERHVHLRERAERLAMLEAQATLTADERWERIEALSELRPAEDLLGPLNELIAAAPEQLMARWRRGLLLLTREDEAGIADIELVMERDAEAIMPGCSAAWNFYRERAPERAEQYAQRARTRGAHLERVQAELSTLPADATLVPATLDEATLDALRAILREHGKLIRCAWLLQRNLKSDATVHDHVLAFEVGRLALTERGEAVVKKLSKVEWPLPIFIVHLGSGSYTKMRKTIKKLAVAPFEFR